MSNYVKNITLSATAVALFMGNITPPSDATFYEDDDVFHHVSKDLNSGWEWGLNKAQASVCDYTDCMSVGPGDYWDDYWDAGNGSDDGTGGDWNDEGSGGDDGGGGGEPSEGEQCKAEVANDVSVCKDAFFYYTSGAGLLCTRVTWGIGATFCGGAASTLVYESAKWCDAQGAAKLERGCT